MAMDEEPVMEKTKKITTSCQGFSIFHRVINLFIFYIFLDAANL